MALDMITTTVGRVAILEAISENRSLQISRVLLALEQEAVSEDTRELTSSAVWGLPAQTSVLRAGDGGYSLHIVATEDGSLSYDVHTLAVELSTGDLLMVTSQEDPIVTKSADASLMLALDLRIDSQTAKAVYSFGPTDFALPMASENRLGAVRLANADETETLLGDGVITASQLGDAFGRYLKSHIWIRPHSVNPTTTLRLSRDEAGIAVQRGPISLSSGILEWTLPPLPRGSLITRAFMKFQRRSPATDRNVMRFTMRLRISEYHVSWDSDARSETFGESFDYVVTGPHSPVDSQRIDIDLPNGFAVLPPTDSFSGFDISLKFSDIVTTGAFNTEDQPLIVIQGFGLEFNAPHTPRVVY